MVGGLIHVSIGGRRNRPVGAGHMLPPAPGRTALELSVVCSAIALLAPVAALAAGALAVVARRTGSSVWARALAAAIWCGFLGLAIRGALGAGVLP